MDQLQSLWRRIEGAAGPVSAFFHRLSHRIVLIWERSKFDSGLRGILIVAGVAILIGLWSLLKSFMKSSRNDRLRFGVLKLVVFLLFVMLIWFGVEEALKPGTDSSTAGLVRPIADFVQQAVQRLKDLQPG